MIYYNYKVGLKQRQSFATLSAAFGDEAPSRACVFNWCAEFPRGRQSLKDEERSGRPLSATTEETVRAMVEEDARVTVTQIQLEKAFSSGSVRTMLHKKVHLSKISARWVPHMLTQEQKGVRVQWCHDMLARFHGGLSNAVWEIISGDESWVYSFEPASKQ